MRDSSRRISPGEVEMVGPDQLGSLVTVFDSDIMRIAVLPAKPHPVLIVDSNAGSPWPVAFQPFQAVASRNAQVVQSNCHVLRLQLPLSDPPHSSSAVALDTLFCAP